MEGKVVKIGEDPLMGEFVGVKITNLVSPVPYREGDIRMLRPGDKVEFITERNGTATIISPKPQVGCERER